MLNYNNFGVNKMIDSNWAFPIGSSGPFGEKSFGEWQTLDQVAYEFLHYTNHRVHRGRLNHSGWFDFHAKLK